MVYIGSSFNMKVRCAGHRRLLLRGKHHNQYLQRAWDKYGGECWSFKVLETTDDYVESEQKWMNQFESFQRDKGYNLQPKAKSSRGYKQSPEHIEKRTLPLRGRPCPNSVREAVAEANRKRLWTPERKEENRNRTWMNFEGKSSRVPNSEVALRLSEGWITGRSNRPSTTEGKDDFPDSSGD
jgi:group I intron endonuclease